MTSFADWLTQTGLAQYVPAFRENDIDFDVARKLTEADLKELGLSLGHRKRFLDALAAIPVEVTAVVSSAQASVAAERRQLTVMFCDLVGSTQLSANLDPEELRELIRAYQAVCAEVVGRYEGHIAQYLGDGLLIYFGHPRAHEDDAQRAVRAGLDMLAAFSARNARTSGAQNISVRIGIHTGLVVVGEMGAGVRQETLALGETPNIAARLQGMAAPDSIVIGAATLKLVQNLFSVEPLGEQEIKGLNAPLALFHVLGTLGSQDRTQAPSRRSALVGRDQELALITDRWERVQDGHGQVVMMVGEPGIGKSRLVSALDDALVQTPHHRAELRCSPYYTHTPLYPFIERLPQRFGWQTGDTPEVELEKMEATLRQFGIGLEESFPLLALLMSHPVPKTYPLPNMSPQRQRRRTMETLAALLAAMAADKPVLLVVEDLHWADPSTLEVIGYHIEQAPTQRILLLLATRPGFQPPWGERSYFTPLLLNRLTLKQTQGFVLQLTQGKPIPSEVLREIVNKTDGVPLFVEELTKSVLESDLLKDYGDHYELDGPLRSLAIPATLQDSLMARLDRLPKGRDVMQWAAALGRSFSFALISAVMGRDENVLREALDQLVKSELLYQKGFGEQAGYVFKHALVQDAAYQSLLKSVRQEIHRKVARVLLEHFEGMASERPEYVAQHFAEAAMPLDAAEYWRRAGERAMERTAFIEAIGHYRKGIDSLPPIADSEQRSRAELQLQLALAQPISLTKGYAAPEMQSISSRAASLAEKIGDTKALCRALHISALTYWVGTDVAKGRVIAEELARLSEKEADPVLSMMARQHLACTDFAIGRFSQARQHFLAMREIHGNKPRMDMFHILGDDYRLVGTHFLSVTLTVMGYIDQAREYCAELATYWPDSPFLFTKIWHPVALTQILTFTRDPFNPQRSIIDAAVELCREQDFDFMGMVLRTLRGALLVQQGDHEQGIADIETGIGFHRAASVGFSLPIFQMHLADAHLRRKKVASGLGAIAEGLAVASQMGDRRVDAELHRLRGELHVMDANVSPTVAEADFVEAIRIAGVQGAKLFELRAACSLARLWQREGKTQAANDVLAPIYNWFTEGFDTTDLVEAKQLIAELSR